MNARRLCSAVEAVGGTTDRGSVRFREILRSRHMTASGRQRHGIRSSQWLLVRRVLAAKSAFAVYPQDDVAVVMLTTLQGSMPERFIDPVASLLHSGASTLPLGSTSDTRGQQYGSSITSAAF